MDRLKQALFGKKKPLDKIPEHLLKLLDEEQKDKFRTLSQEDANRVIKNWIATGSLDFKAPLDDPTPLQGGRRRIRRSHNRKTARRRSSKRTKTSRRK